MKSRNADLSPPLGYPGGHCQVVQRIDDSVRNDRVRDILVDKVEDGEALTNTEAGVVYHLEVERGPGSIKLEISPHAMYRMDLRGVTVPEVRLTFQRFMKEYGDWRSQKDYRAQEIEQAMRDGHQSVAWVDKKLGLFSVWSFPNRGIARLVTTYWKGLPDPRAYPCDASDLQMHTAAKFQDILNGVSPKVVGDSSGLTVKLTKVSKKNKQWSFTVSGGKDAHAVRLKAIPKREGLSKLSASDVLVSCDCRFWQWQGPEHWASVGGYLLGKPVGTATRPDAKDPTGQNRVCKHVAAVIAMANGYFLPEAEVRKMAFAVAARHLGQWE